VGVKQCVCQTQDAGESPPEVTILKHGYSFERGFVSAVKPDSQSTHDEPVTKLWTKTVIVVTAKVRSNTTKKITGVTWYFVLKKAKHEWMGRAPEPKVLVQNVNDNYCDDEQCPFHKLLLYSLTPVS
jgi:hypothetical protein